MNVVEVLGKVNPDLSITAMRLVAANDDFGGLAWIPLPPSAVPLTAPECVRCPLLADMGNYNQVVGLFHSKLPALMGQ